MPTTRARPAVAAGHPATVAAAIEVLRAGGNAFDAAVAAGFAAGVVEPVLSSLGGGGFLLARTAGGDEVLFDFFVDTPGRGVPDDVEPEMAAVDLRFGNATQTFHVGHGSVAVPGCLAGYLHVHARLGRLPLAEVVAPARRAAETGVVVGPHGAATVRLVEAILTLTPAGRERFRPGDRPLADDAVLPPDPALAATLAAIGDGRLNGFGDDHLAGRIEADNRAGGGVLTAADLAAYRVVEREPLVVTHRGARLVTNPAPSLGATLVGRALAHLEAAGAPASPGSPTAVVRIAQALREVGRHHRGPGPVSTRGTTHVSVCDADGNLAAMTTSNGSGSGVPLADTGVLANNIMGEEDLHPEGLRRLPAGLRVGSMMAPSILDRPDAPPVVLGSGGSERIRSAIAQVVAHLVDEGAAVPDAVLAPRLHVDGDEVVQLEPGHDPAAVAALREAGFATNVWSVTDLYFGGVHAVSSSGAHVGDPRRGGTSAAP
ncbi:gamma-glutamyltransferase [Nitriliruptoraceae bacterium ZYF776]|nr:gamma-glutamyltransferase [Profundirhabdus halotolerans]